MSCKTDSGLLSVSAAVDEYHILSQLSSKVANLEFLSV